jgi:hypothetical protein
MAIGLRHQSDTASGGPQPLSTATCSRLKRPLALPAAERLFPITTLVSPVREHQRVSWSDAEFDDRIEEIIIDRDRLPALAGDGLG